MHLEGWAMHPGILGGHGMGLLGGLIGLLLFAGFVIAMVLVVFWIVRQSRSDKPVASQEFAGSRPALDILDERYARGELSREEYLQARDDLGATAP